MSREKKVENCRNDYDEGGSIFSISLKSKKGWSAPVYMNSARKHLPKDNREAAKTFTIGKTLDLPVELSSQLPEGVDAITRNGKIYVSSTADDPAKGVFREYLAKELHLPEGSSEILNPYLNDIPTIEKVWREAPELGIVIFQEIDRLRKQLKKQGSFFDDFFATDPANALFLWTAGTGKKKVSKESVRENSLHRRCRLLKLFFFGLWGFWCC